MDSQLEGFNDNLPSVLRTLVAHKRLDLLRLRQIRQLIRDKWSRSVRYVFAMQFVAFLAALAFLALHVDCAHTVEECAPYYWACFGSATFLGFTFAPPLPRCGFGPGSWARGCARWLCICCSGGGGRVGGRVPAASASPTASFSSAGASFYPNGRSVQRSASGKSQLSSAGGADGDEEVYTPHNALFALWTNTTRMNMALLFSTPCFVTLVLLSLFFHPAGLGPKLVEKAPEFWRIAIICRSHGEPGQIGFHAPPAPLPAPPAPPASPDAPHGPPTSPEAEHPWQSPCGGEQDGILTANLILALASIVGWARFVSLCASIHRRFGPFVIVMVRMTLNDVARFLVFNLALLIAFSTALVAASRTYSTASPEWSYPPMTDPGAPYLRDCMYLLLRGPFDDVSSVDEAFNHPVPYLSRPLVIIYQFFVSLVLLNLLIALMNNTHSKIAHNAWLEWYWQFAELVLRAERTWLGDLLKCARTPARDSRLEPPSAPTFHKPGRDRTAVRANLAQAWA